MTQRLFLSIVVFAVLALAAAQSYFETNDDVAMCLLARGAVYAAAPDEHLLFTNVGIGLPLKWLYTAAPRLPWYGLYQVSAVFLAVAGLALGLSRRGVPPLLVAVFLVVAGVPCLAEVQFTKTAFLSALAGLLLLLPRDEAGPSKGDAAFGVALFLLGSLVRFESAALAVIVVPCEVPALRALRNQRMRLLPLAVAFVLAAAGWAGDRAYYNADPAWRDFRAWNAARVQFTDYRTVNWTTATAPAISAVGWDELDIALLENSYLDPDRHTLAKLQTVLNTAGRSRPWDPVGVTGHIAEQLITTPATLRLVLLGASVALTGGWRRGLLVFGFYVRAFVVLVAIGTFWWWVPRVTFCAIAGATAVGLSAPAANCPRWTRVLIILFGAGLAIWAIGDAVNAASQFEFRWSDSVQFLKRLKPSRDRLIIAWGQGLPTQNLVRPFDSAPELVNLRCLSLSALTTTPFSRQRLDEYGGDLPHAVERRDVELVLTAGSTDVMLFAEYFRRRFGRPVRIRSEFSFQAPPISVFRGAE
jgi:hypothetical protein